ncbi:Probable cytochrome P450 6v1 [Eumeta japonica]|uniref:unspecific monooxygenase n=1 Tax=Eumeta variegata TaxID=151549 RepID=A0A4C1SFG5_EUMVA|nr:Probable cytochrome P450 6v1 [Eumeta japonica]
MLDDRREMAVYAMIIELLLTFQMEAELKRQDTFAHQEEYLVARHFQLAGIQTCSSTLAFALYELARQPALQERLHFEIRQTLGNEDPPTSLSFEKVESMTYLNMVVEETLRKYPVVPFWRESVHH